MPLDIQTHIFLFRTKKIIKKQWLDAFLYGDFLFSWDVFSYIFQ